MKGFPTAAVGLAALGAVGLVFLGAGLWKPGQVGLPELPGGSLKPLLTEARKKASYIREGREGVQARLAKLAGLKGSEGEHRVFVSAQLVYLPENAEPVQPLDRKTKTEDGMEVGWKIRYGFDPADPLVKEQDPDGDGFTNLEEFSAGTDPTRNEDSPAKESKLKSRAGDPVPMVVSFAEKSGGLFTLRFQVGARRGEFRGKPGDMFWVWVGPASIEVFSEEGKMKAAQSKAQEAGQSAHVIPLRFASYEEKLETIKDATAGGLEMEVDNSFVLLKRMDAIAGSIRLVLSAPSRPRSISWDVGDIRFFAPGSPTGELGPFRIGEVFPYGGKEFAIIGREGRKIQLLNQSEPGKDPFWVPVDGGGSSTQAKP